MPSQPRVIRQVIKRDRYDRPQIALDRKEQIRLKMIRQSARSHMCLDCGDTIPMGTSYARVIDLRNTYWVGGGRIPLEFAYHWWCTPPRVDRLLRFFGLSARPIAPPSPEELPECERCGGSGWIWDDSACGDPDHCSSVFACSECNPEGED